MNHQDIRLTGRWLYFLQQEFTKNYMLGLYEFLQIQQQKGHQIFPEEPNIFRAFELTDFDNVKVVVLGQDPYHGFNQAHGLSFSVPIGVPIPPSLLNIYKELETDVDFIRPNHGNLISWAEKGVLLLNSVLTVEEGKAASHQNKGWEKFTDAVVETLNEHREHIVFLLWGAYAQRKGRSIDRDRHLVLESAHPSPLSAYRGFLGNRHFSQTNNYLTEHDIEPIYWQIG